MIKITMVKTADGAMHKSEKDAKRHLDGVYANAIGKLAHSLVRDADKYSKAAAWINDHLNDFAELSAIKTDMQLIEESEEE